MYPIIEDYLAQLYSNIECHGTKFKYTEEAHDCLLGTMYYTVEPLYEEDAPEMRTPH